MLATTDHMEMIVEAALIARGVRYVTDVGGKSPANLDFYLPEHDVHIEVKRMHSDRIAEQMSRAPNVIAVQGEGAVRLLAAWIGRE